MRSRRTVLLLACLAASAAWATRSSVDASNPVGIFEQHGDIGSGRVPGSAAYDVASQTYTLSGSGGSVWAGTDEGHFAWTRISGDFILQARVDFPGKGLASTRKVGLMVRSTLNASSAYISLARLGEGLAAVAYRRSSNANPEEVRSDSAAVDVLQLERKGDTYTLSGAKFGEAYATRRVTDLRLGDVVYVGIFVGARNAETAERGVLHNVRLISPAKDDFVPYRDYLGSDVELLDVQTGMRRTVHHADDSIQAPNWTPNGQRLLMNRNGRIYSFDLASSALTEIPTGTMTRNNNDHALSFDGKMLGLSGGSPSTVWTVPSGGGTPKQVVPVGPSYLHGWSPDGSTLVFTGQRNGDFDIYSMPAGGGPEKRLTTAVGIDDGPEFTPDGEWVYFNSLRTGRMQIWRMKPDGSQQQQLTFDNANNWFPHVSPDGRTVVFVTYGPEIPPGDHPWYKRVYIRKMPLDGGTPSVVAYVYGGQGTMNVNSWAPDSRRLAFVSNSGAF